MARRDLVALSQEAGPIGNFVREHRKKLGYTQPQLATNTGVGVRFLRELERGKTTLQLDKVNQVLSYFGYELAPVAVKRKSPFEDDVND